MEKDQQVKGKGNGDIDPKYIEYVVKFLEWSGMEVGDSEMKHLGYINVDKFKKYLHKDTKFFNKKYWYTKNQLLDKDGGEFSSFDLLDQIPLLDEKTLKLNFKLESFIKLSIDFLFKTGKKKNIASGDYSKAASSGDSSTAASSGNYSTAASSGDSSKAASSGNSSKAASSGNSSKAASSGDYSTAASSGIYSTAASSGNSSKAETDGEETIACALGWLTKAKGTIGSWIVLTEYSKDGTKILAIESAKIDGKKLKPQTWYQLKNKRFVEVKE